MKRPFTDDDIEFIKKNYGPMSGAAIAAALGRSRGAVIGKAHRLGLANQRPKATRYKPKHSARTTTKARTPSNRKKDDTARVNPDTGRAVNNANGINTPWRDDMPDTGGRALKVLRIDQCRWPVGGEGRETRFCGLKCCTRGNGMYCDDHATRAYGVMR